MKKQWKDNTKEIERLFKEHYALLYLVSLGIVKDRETAKDVVQDFFISYWQKREHISLTVSFKSYAIKAVKNLSLLSVKKIAREKSLLRHLDVGNFEEQQVSTGSDKSLRLQELLNKLPESRRKIFMSFVVNGQSYSEIAENNGISVNTVKTQMKRAYAFLRTEATKDVLYFCLFIFSVPTY
ncbi:sigma-70 family RNA polymerase sigma factor [Ulvibacterium sp.]|uniref:sigma-70 family RNA polymerase sigma factor n=1 Tax=Ulvibacterium sp. TaxID=2665914 RepID=UPI003BAD2BD1